MGEAIYRMKIHGVGICASIQEDYNSITATTPPATKYKSLKKV